jgi:hypothetical protein
MASTTSLLAFPPGRNSETFFPLATITSEAAFARDAASLRASFRLARIVSLASIPFASRNLDARVQDVQPFRV